MSSIGRGFDPDSSSIYPVLSRAGGIRPPNRKRSRLVLMLLEYQLIAQIVPAQRGWLGQPFSKLPQQDNLPV
jgi:hypothetical protein